MCRKADIVQSDALPTLLCSSAEGSLQPHRRFLDLQVEPSELSCKHAGTEAGSTKKALLKLLRPGGGLASAGAVIAYATFQMQAEQVAQYLTAHGVKAAAYHAGKHMKVCAPSLLA